MSQFASVSMYAHIDIVLERLHFYNVKDLEIEATEIIKIHHPLHSHSI